MFSGSKTFNDDQLKVDFEELNTTVLGAMKLKTGDRIKTFIAVEKGILDIQVKNATVLPFIKETI